jgi:EAL domain-containing protein (putative c-di-GMP-specific phosphodiesterase class I)
MTVRTEFEQCRILIVDDEPANVTLLVGVLQAAGYRNVRELTDPRQALGAFLDWLPDLVLLDLHMPFVDGLTLMGAMRAEVPESDFVPVLVLTADGSRDTLRRALNRGANDYLTKPLDLEEVLLRVRNLLAIRLAHDALRESNTDLANSLRERVRFEDVLVGNRDERVAEMQATIDAGPSMAFQPIIELATHRPVGFEALARFDSEKPPGQWFAEASMLGLGAELELSAVSVAFSQLDVLANDEFMAINVSPAVVLDARFRELIERQARDRIVVEIGEDQPFDDYDGLAIACEDLREAGTRIAIDASGSSSSSLQHLAALEPDIIKIGIGLTRAIDSDPVKRAQAASLLQFAQETNATVTAVGIESVDELLTLQSLGVQWGQGFLIGQPDSSKSAAGPVYRLS